MANNEINIIQEINNAFKDNKYSNVFLYPICEIKESGSTIVPTKISSKNIADMLKDNEHVVIIIEEFYYRDLVKIVENKSKVSYANKHIYGKIIGEHLLCSVNYVEINENKFPHANIGICKETKNIIMLNISNLHLEHTELMLENDSFCIKIKQKPSSSDNKKKLRKEITDICMFVKKLVNN